MDLLNVKVFPGLKIHNMDIEVIRQGRGQKLPELKDLTRSFKKRLLIC